MTTRLRLLGLLVTFIGLVALTWYFVRDKQSRQLAPKEKTTAELLVGTWKEVEQDGYSVEGPGREYRLEFTADGKLHIFVHDRLNPPATETGTYELIGDTIHGHIPVDRYGGERRWEAKIDSITDADLAITAKRGKVSSAHRYRRVVSEK